jgi:hypothetical protein
MIPSYFESKSATKLKGLAEEGPGEQLVLTSPRVGT